MMRTALALLALSPLASPQERDAEPVSFHAEVLPLLRASCQGCHQPARPQGVVVLIRHSDLMAHRNADEAYVVPGRPDASVLVDVITPFDGDPPVMPKDADPLSDDQVALIRRWIEEGAHDDTPASFRSRPGGPPVYERAPVVTSLAYSPSGELLAVAGRGEVLVHRPGEGGSEIAHRLVGLSERIESVAFSPDGSRLAVAGGSPARTGELQVWKVATAELLFSVPATHDTLRGVSWSPDGSKIAFGCKDTTLRAVDAKSGKELLYQSAHDDWVLGTAFSSDASHLVSVGRDRSMKLVKVDTQQFIDNITSITPGALKGGLLSVERHPATDELLVGGSDGAPKIFRMYREKKRVIGDDYNLIRTFEPLPGRVFAVDWSPEADWIAAAASSSDAGTVRAYRTEDGSVLWTRSFPSGMYTLDVHPEGERLAAAGFAGEIVVLDAASGAGVQSFPSVPLAGARPIEAARHKIEMTEEI